MRRWTSVQAVEENQHDLVGGFEGGQDRDNIAIPNSTNYNPSQIISQESPVKLPLAPIVSTPSDRRANATAVSTRRGSAIFSPTQTLDHHHHRHQLNPPPPPPLHVRKDPNPDPDPATPTTDYGPSNYSKAPASSPPQPQAPPPQSPAPPPPPPPASTSSSTLIRYRECLKNHAASMGAHVVDGCGEFMPSGEEGTAEALRCAACDCHRNFHRKEVDGEAAAQPSNFHPLNPNSNNSNRTPLVHGQTPPPTAAHHHHHHHKHSHSYSQHFASGPKPPPAMVNFGGGGAAADESSSEDLTGGGGHAMMQPSSKKRFRTKFSQEQKGKMQEFAEKLGWRIQKQDAEQVQQFCNENGVKRQVFKVWMHNNKQAMKKRQI